LNLSIFGKGLKKGVGFFKDFGKGVPEGVKEERRIDETLNFSSTSFFSSLSKNQKQPNKNKFSLTKPQHANIRLQNAENNTINRLSYVLVRA
jgi:hypothetical protein